jgi:autotransporter translocation and assembly factor TamB
VGGSLEEPTFEGSLDLSRARLRLAGVAQDLRAADISVTASGRRFDIRMEAEEGALEGGGYFAISGTRVVDWNLGLTLKDYWVTEFDDFFARLDGEVRINTRTVAGRPVPDVSGDLVVREGEYSFTLGGNGTGGQIIGPSTSPSWLLNVSVEIPNAFWIRTDEIDAELQGDLNVKVDEEGLMMLGSLRVIRGSFYFYHNSFKITRGEFRFADVKSLDNVYIDLEAESRVLDEKIWISAKGNLNKLDPPTVRSESGWTEMQIAEALLLRRGASPDESVQGGVFSEEFVRAWAVALGNRFGKDVARRLNLDRFGIQLTDAAEGDALASTRVTFGKYVSDKFYLEYEQSLGSLYGDRTRFTQQGLSLPERQLSVEYRLSDRFSFEGEAGTVGGLGYFEFDVRYRYGY